MGFTHRMGGMIVSRTKATAQKRLARLLRGRIEPHGKEMTDESINLIGQTFEDHRSKEGSIIYSSHQESDINVSEEVLL